MKLPGIGRINIVDTVTIPKSDDSAWKTCGKVQNKLDLWVQVKREEKGRLVQVSGRYITQPSISTDFKLMVCILTHYVPSITVPSSDLD